MIVISTGAFARTRAAFRPPNPEPTITTRGLSERRLSELLITSLRRRSCRPCCYESHLYKIQRDGRRFQKFFRPRSSIVGACGHAVSGGFNLRRAADGAGVHAALGAPAGRRR